VTNPAAARVIEIRDRLLVDGDIRLAICHLEELADWLEEPTLEVEAKRRVCGGFATTVLDPGLGRRW